MILRTGLVALLAYGVYFDAASAQQVACQRVGTFVQCSDGSSGQNYGPYVYNQQQGNQPQQYQGYQPNVQNFQQFNPGRCLQNPYSPGCR